jgi:hypothetical protein
MKKYLSLRMDFPLCRIIFGSQQIFDFRFLFKQHTTTNMTLRFHAAFPYLAEQGGLERLPEASGPETGVGIRGERTRLRSAEGIDVKKSAPGRQTSPKLLFIAGERKKKDIRIAQTQIPLPFGENPPLILSGRQAGVSIHGNIFHKENQAAAVLAEPFHKIRAGYRIQIFLCHRDRRAVKNAAASHFLRCPRDKVEDSLPTPAVRLPAAALDAYNRNQVPVAVKPVEHFPGEQCPIRENRKDQSRCLCRLFEHVGPFQRFAASQQDKRNAKAFCF